MTATDNNGKPPQWRLSVDKNRQLTGYVVFDRRAPDAPGQTTEQARQGTLDWALEHVRQWEQSHPALTLLTHLGGQSLKDPAAVHFRIARTTIKREHAKEETSEAVDKLARRLLEAEEGAREALGLQRWELAVGEAQEQTAQAECFESWSALEQHYMDNRKSVRIDEGNLETTLAELAGANAPKGNLFALDALAASFMERTGKAGKEGGAKIRSASRKRWAQRKEPDVDLWHLWRLKEGGGLRFQNWLARALWFDVVRPQLERERGQYQAITRPIFHGLLSATSQKSELIETLDGRHGIRLGKHTIATMPGDNIAALIRRRNIGQAVATEDAIKKILAESVRALESLDAQRLIRFLVLSGFRHWQDRPVLDLGRETERIIIPGGYEQLAIWTGSKGGRGQAIIRAALDALELIKIQYGGGNTVWLVAVEEKGPAPGRPARLAITVNWPLLPVGMNKLGGADALGVPIPAPNMMPPFVTRRNEHAKEAQLHLRVMAYAATCSPELAQSGGIEGFSQVTVWRNLLDESGIASKYTDAIREAYFAPVGGLFPVLKLAPNGLICLADSRANDFLVEQGQRRLIQHKRGKAMARKKKPKAT